MFGAFRILTAAAVLSVAGVVSLPARAETPVGVFAAASLKNALDAAAAAWTSDTGGTTAITYAGSSALARQIEQGAPADIFISASTDWMEDLEGKGLIRDGSRIDLLGNTLVVVATGAAQPDLTIADLPGKLGDGKLAMALVDSVPAGVYGKTALGNLGLWAALEPHVAQAENVRAALSLVARGEAPYGIVYATDAVAEPGVSVVATFPADSHAPIIYPAAVVKASANDAAPAFLEWLATPRAAAFFHDQGFSTLGGTE